MRLFQHLSYYFHIFNDQYKYQIMNYIKNNIYNLYINNIYNILYNL